MLTTNYRKSWKDLSREEVKRVIQIQQLNDRLRKTLPRTKDMIVIMGDLSEEESAVQNAAYQAVRAFDGFTEDNDPYGEHDSGTVSVKIGDREEKIMFKIDYYDLDLRFHSPDAANPDVTRRVMSIFFARDY